MENVINSSVTSIGSLNSTNFANNTSSSYGNTIIVKYAKSKKIFNSRTRNIILKKNLSVSVGFSLGKLPFVHTKRLLFQTNSLFCYIKNTRKLSRSNRVIKAVAQHFRRSNEPILNKKITARLKPYVLHPYFTNFELDLYKPFWVFLGTPIFNAYFDKILRTSSDNFDDLDTSFIDARDSFKEFYDGVFFRSKKKYNINRVLTSLSRLSHVDSFSDQTTSTSEFSDYSEEDDNQVFRVYYDGDMEDDDMEEDLEEFTPFDQTIWDTPYLFLNTIHGLDTYFELTDYAPYYLLELVSDHIETELGIDLNKDIDVSKFKSLRRIKKRRKYNRFYRKTKKLVLGCRALKLFKNSTCSSFFVSFVVAKNFQKSKLKSEQPIVMNLECEFEKTVDTNLSLSYLEFLVGNLQSTNYLNLKFKFVLNAASWKTYNISDRTISEVTKTKRAASTPINTMGLQSHNLRQFKDIFSELETQIFRIGRLIKLKSIKKSKLKNFARLNERSKFHFVLKKFFKRYNLVPKKYKKCYTLFSKILKMTIKKGSLNKLKSSRKLSSMINSDMFLLALYVTSGEHFKRISFASVVTTSLKPLKRRLKTIKRKYVLSESDSSSKSGAKKKIKRRVKRKTKNRTKKASVRKKTSNHRVAYSKRHLLSSIKSRYASTIPSGYTYFLKNQLFVKRHINKNQPVLRDRRYLTNLTYFNKTNPILVDTSYLDLSINLLTSYFSKFNTLLNTKISFKNQNKNLMTNINVENYFNNFFIQHSFIYTASENSAASKGLTLGTAYMQWFTKQFHLYSRATLNLHSSELVWAQGKTILNVSNTRTYCSSSFFATFTKLSSTYCTPNGSSLSSQHAVQSAKPFFKTVFNNAFVLSTYGFYFKMLPEDGTVFTTTLLRSYLHSAYSFVESLNLKKKILKSFLAKPVYQLSEDAFSDVYDTFGFNFYAINHSLTSAKPYTKSSSRPTDSLYIADYPFYNLEEEFEPEPDKSLRIKFKPGYSIIWRRVRALFKEVFFLKFKYQHRLTTHLFSYEHNIFRKDMYRKTDNNIHLLLIRNKFAFDLSWSMELLENHYVFINGFMVTNPQTILVKGDFVQLLVHIKYYMIIKWRHSVSIIKKTRAYKFAKRKFRPKDIRMGADRNYTYPDWLLKLRFYDSEIPSFVEIDFFTLSFLVIYNPFVDSHTDPYVDYVGIPKVVRLYNWKYIN